MMMTGKMKFLSTAVLTLSVLIGLGGSCSAQATSKYKESPQLAELVKANKLPPVDARMPEQPLLVPLVDSVGQYGGVWRRAFLGPADANNYVRVVFDSLFRFSPDGSKIEPKIASSAEPSADFKSWTVNLRKGARWSDGTPLTADDIMFWYKDVLLNKDLTPTLPGWMRNSDGTPAVVEKLNDYSVKFSFQAPATMFLTALVAADGGDRTYAAFLPAHYLKKFHPTYTSKEEIDKLVAGAGFKTWTELFATRNAPPENIERPTMAAWIASSRVSDPVFTLKRNPYYIGVDKDGQQLPYIDEVRFTYFADTQALNLAAIAGEFDIQERHIQMNNYPVFKDQEKIGKYKVITWPTFGGADAVVMFNQTYKGDAEMGKLMATKEFRIALSHAVNRDQIKESVFLGLGEARQGVPAPWHPYYPGDEYAKKYTAFDLAKANKMLDDLGLSKKDANGIRLLPSGKPVTLEISVVPAFGAWPDVAQLIAKDWEKAGIKVIVQIRERALHFKMRDSNDLMTEIWNDDTTAFPFTGNAKVDVRNSVILALGTLYGQWFNTKGKEGQEPTPEIKKIIELIDHARTVGTEGQIKDAQELYKIWADQIYEIGIVGLTPMIQGVVVVNNKLKNVPAQLGNDWPLRTPGNARPEQFYYTK
jgi:peptide/nickel transport system substrate-binding protein